MSSIRPRILALHERLDITREKIIEIIQTKTDLKIVDANPSSEYNIEDEKAQMSLMNIPQMGKVHLASPSVIRYGIKKDPNITPGIYNALNGKIILNIQNWCLCTLIHETLHSISNFSRIYTTLECQEFPCEGITELLTGHILCGFSESLQRIIENNCCSGWKPPNGCYLARHRIDAMIIYFIAQKIGLRQIYSLYLNSTIDDPIAELVRLLTETGIPFNNVFSGCTKVIILRRRLQEELTKCYPNEFTSFMKRTQLDFNIPL